MTDTAFIERLKTEMMALQTKHLALKMYIDENPQFKTLSEKMQALMILQEHHMLRYWNTLVQRYDLLTLGEGEKDVKL